MKTRRNVARAIAGLIAAAVLAGAGTNAAAQDAIRIGLQPSWAPASNIGKALEVTNILEKNGLQGQFTSFIAGGPAIEAMLADKIDVILVGDAPAVILAARGSPAKWVAKLQDYRGALLVRKDAPLAKLEDIKGKNVAAFVSSGVYAQFYGWLTSIKLDPNKDIRLINLRPADWIAALRRGEVDAVMAWDPIIAAGALEPDLRILHQAVSPAPGVTIMNAGFIAKNRDAAVRFMAAYKEAVHFMANSGDELMKRLSDENKMAIAAIKDASTYDGNFKNARAMKDVRVRFNDPETRALQGIGELLAELKQIKKAPDVRTVIDASLLDEAEKRMGANYDAKSVRLK